MSQYTFQEWMDENFSGENYPDDILDRLEDIWNSGYQQGYNQGWGEGEEAGIASSDPAVQVYLREISND